MILEQWFSTWDPRNPTVTPAQSRGSARSYENAMIDRLLQLSCSDMRKGVPRATGIHSWGFASPIRLQATVLELRLFCCIHASTQARNWRRCPRGSKTYLYNHCVGAKALFSYVTLQGNNSFGGGAKPYRIFHLGKHCPHVLHWNSIFYHVHFGS